MQTTKNQNRDRMLVASQLNLQPPTDWEWLATVNSPVNPKFITLYAFKPAQEPEVYFIWVNDYEAILYWLAYLYQFPDVQRHVLASIFSPRMPVKLFEKAIKLLHQLKDYDPGIPIHQL